MNHSERLEEVVAVALSMTHGCIPNYIAPGLNSYLLGSDPERKHGSCRMFLNTRDQEFFVTPHSHRFDFACCVLRGWAKNTLYEEGYSHMPNYRRSSYDRLTKQAKPEDCAYFAKRSTIYHQGDWYTMACEEFHSIEFSHDAVVLFLEGAQEQEITYILEPVVGGLVVPTFKVEPWMYNSREHK